MAEKETEEKASSGSSMKLIIIILVVLLLIVIGAGVALFMMGGDKSDETTGEEAAVEEVQTPKIPIYVPLHPAFLANFEDQSSAAYIQADVQVMTYDEAVEVAIKTHMPQIRNDLLLLFGSQKYEELNTVKGKRELSKKAIEVVSKVLKDAGEPHAIESFLFTSFVMQ